MGSRSGGAGDSAPYVVRLDEVITGDAASASPTTGETIGRKAAALARAGSSGLPVLPGVVVTVAGAAAPPGTHRAQLAAAVAALPEPWIVRSSSPHEDGENASQAGHFLSVRDVVRADPVRIPDAAHTGGEFARLFAAVDAVVASGDGAPMAVLVQPQREFDISGVLFGVDPVTGRPGTVVAATAGSPEGLVSGTEDGTLLTLGPRGTLKREGTRVRRLFGFAAGQLGRSLARLARDAAELFGRPQDIEWGWTEHGGLILLQSRPVTKIAAAVPDDAVVLGAGPLAETFPAPLWPLEEDLWLPPLSAGLEAALRRSGAAGTRRPRRPEPAHAHPDPWNTATALVRSVGGQPVVPLRVFGVEPLGGKPSRRLTALLDPRPGLRRLRVAWSVGGLRAVLPAIAADLVRETDALLVGVPPAHDLTDAQLVGVLRQSGPLLTALHEHEALMGMVMRDKEEPTTAVGVALRLLAVSDRPADELVREEPVLLALVPPSIAAPVWPETAHTPPPAAHGVPTPADPRDRPAAGVLREALRLRARWTQELQATAVREIAARLVAQGRLADPDAVRALRLDELLALLREPTRAWHQPADRTPPPTPLPTAFRIAEDGTPVALVARPGRRRGTAGAGLHGQGASAGRATGTVVHDPAELDGLPERQGVLVVRTLAPGLAATLPRLGGLIAETGSPLSHLAILAREHGVPAVVAAHGALDVLAPGDTVLVDGRTGVVETPTDTPAAPPAPTKNAARAEPAAPDTREAA
ncbi:hypothetical protein LO772_00780 [Yinghuangia sp. ASG 101]|uniref:PEP-utilizing enzyme n=1 Tax=Yinghuangia sp. ASG 101 TaxID=2896848 RepID=UPI001E2AC009|nr:PEP-utilizing enzyme [Yinghuangia sp. ASG 101]UGQ12179.1 hypothetical protein LO772_00780 [Yinghuangia sp. ASG 101]